MGRSRRMIGRMGELMLKPLLNIDVSRPSFEGLHQLRVFRDVTPGFSADTGIFILLLNQQYRNELKEKTPAWYTGRLEQDVVPIKFIDLDKLYYALEEAKKLQAELENEAPVVVEPVRVLDAPTLVVPKAARMRG